MVLRILPGFTTVGCGFHCGTLLTIALTASAAATRVSQFVDFKYVAVRINKVFSSCGCKRWTSPSCLAAADLVTEQLPLSKRTNSLSRRLEKIILNISYNRYTDMTNKFTKKICNPTEISRFEYFFRLCGFWRFFRGQFANISELIMTRKLEKFYFVCYNYKYTFCMGSSIIQPRLEG